MMLLETWLIAASLAGASGAAKPNDLRDFALAECLIKQSVSSELREEGFRLGEIAMYRADIDLDTWKSLTRAVDAEVTSRPMMTAHIDAPVAQSDKAVPLAYCLAVIDSARVQAAMARLRSAPAHKR